MKLDLSGPCPLGLGEGDPRDLQSTDQVPPAGASVSAPAEAQPGLLPARPTRGAHPHGKRPGVDVTYL